MAAKPLTTLGAALVQVARTLDSLDVAWALVGGLAVSARAQPRLTRDVDIAVSVTSDAHAEELLFALQQRGYTVDTVLEQSRLERLATARLSFRRGDAAKVIVDLLFASSGIEPEVVAAASSLEVLPGVRVPVARIGHLIAMKVLARDDRARPQDFDDLRALLSEAGTVELNRARRALEAIEASGAHRGRRLLAALERAITEVSTEGAAFAPRRLRARRPKKRS